jgi:hypothetical protein
MKTKIFHKKSILLILGFVFFSTMFSSCNKDTTTSTGSFLIQFKVDGTLVEYTSQSSLMAVFAHSGAQYNAVFSGYDELSNINLSVYYNKEITSGTYSGYTLAGSAIVGSLISYQDKSGTNYTQASVNSDASITISEITATTVKGFFSGTLLASGKPDIVITNGEFFVWRAN